VKRLNTRSVRFRLTVWYALILSAALCIFSGLIWVMMTQRLERDIRRGLGDEASRFEAFVQKEASEVPAVNLYDEIEEFCHALPSSSYLELRPAAEARVRTAATFRYPAHPPAPRDHYQILTRAMLIRGQPFTLEIGASRAEMHRALELLQTLLFSLVPLVIALSCLGGAWLSRRALRPVDEITSAARAIGIENLASRLPDLGTGDELERLAETWNATLARLESAVAVLSRFAADASHELRTPVAVIRTSAELALRRDRDPEAYREALRGIAAESERMTQLVEDLLFLARRDTRGDGMPMSPTDLREVLNDAAQELHGLADARNIRLRVRASVDDATIAGNAAALRRLFLALFDNALKYSGPGTEVTATVLSKDGRIVATVQDQGIGIAAEDMPHIFQRFYRANQARSDGGHGLGLSLAQSIAAAHDAVIEAESELGRGSVFRVSFERRATGTDYEAHLASVSRAL
jgi:two-component system heavy metal sensor histidine kinase CusS